MAGLHPPQPERELLSVILREVSNANEAKDLGQFRASEAGTDSSSAKRSVYRRKRQQTFGASWLDPHPTVSKTSGRELKGQRQGSRAGAVNDRDYAQPFPMENSH